MTESKTIEPQEVQPGDRICIAWSTQGVDRTMTLTVVEVDLESMLVKNGDGYWASLSLAGRATITLLDRPEPERPVGSHWRDPKTSAEYVIDIDGDAVLVAGDRSSDAYLIGRADDDLARLQPIPALDPAALWPAANSVPMHCLALYTAKIGWMCSRPIGHDGLHAAYDGHEPGAKNLRYVWGDPR